MTQHGEPVVILMAEDDAEDRMLARDALNAARLANELYMVEDGEELMDFLLRRGRFQDPAASPRPGLILLDLNMPKKSGLEALAEIKAEPELRRIPIVVLTSSNAEEDVFQSYDLGVNSFITKPVSFQGLVEVVRTLGRYWFEIVELPRP